MGVQTVSLQALALFGVLGILVGRICKSVLGLVVLGLPPPYIGKGSGANSSLPKRNWMRIFKWIILEAGPTALCPAANILNVQNCPAALPGH